MTRGRSQPEIDIQALAMQRSAHSDKASEVQNQIIRKMSPDQRLATAAKLYTTAWEIKKSALKTMHPDWTEAAIASRTRRIFLTGYAGD